MWMVAKSRNRTTSETQRILSRLSQEKKKKKTTSQLESEFVHPQYETKNKCATRLSFRDHESGQGGLGTQASKAKPGVFNIQDSNMFFVHLSQGQLSQDLAKMNRTEHPTRT